MNLAYFIGLFVCVVLIVFGIVFDSTTMSLVFGNIMNFIDVPSLLITVGGTLAALVSTFPLKQTAQALKHLPIILGLRKQNPAYYINTLVEISTLARKKGLLALEDMCSEFEDPFLRNSVMLVVDGMAPEKVREQLENELNNIETRHAMSWDFYDKGAALAPGFGMIGTLIGLINMLKSMNFDDEGGAATLAMNMAVALITTFYGSVMANVIFIPLGSQLRAQHNEEMLCKEIIIEGVMSVQAGENPRHIGEKLTAFLTYKQREQISASNAAVAAEE